MHRVCGWVHNSLPLPAAHGACHKTLPKKKATNESGFQSGCVCLKGSSWVRDSPSPGFLLLVFASLWLGRGFGVAEEGCPPHLHAL